MPEREMHDTTQRTVVPSVDGGYRSLGGGPGEAHLTRTDLVAARPDGEARRIARLIHLTDFQIADLASPSRVEFLQRITDDPEWARMLPAYRPQEFLLLHAMEAVMRTTRALVERSPGEWDLAITTGDNTDTAQANELETYLTMLDGGHVEPARGTHGFRDAPVLSGDDEYWNPDPRSRDRWKRERGLPDHPGAVHAAREPFEGVGLGLPWLTSFGNHDCLVQGRAAAPEGYDAFLTGDRKPVGRPASVPQGDKLDAYVEHPAWASGGESRRIEARDDRRMFDKGEYVERHLRSPSLPAGHGFTRENLAAGTTYYVYDDIPGVRLITLDTTNPAGHVDGSVDEEQFRWLEERLQEVNSSYITQSGQMVGTEADDRLVVICSHHGLSTMTNATGASGGRHLADDVEALLQRFPNVILWLSGHTHVNRITARPRDTGGFWEVATSSIAEWPVQVRTIAVDLFGDVARIRTTMIDPDIPDRADGGTGLTALAALHREVAANDPGSVGGLHAEGSVADRNTDLLVPLRPGTGRRIAGA